MPEEIEIAELTSALEQGAKPQVVDVREGWERALGAIEPSLLIPLSELERGKPNLSGLDSAKPTVVYCAAGVRSLRGAELLRLRHGFRNVTSLRGGLNAWAKPR